MDSTRLNEGLSLQSVCALLPAHALHETEENMGNVGADYSVMAAGGGRGHGPPQPADRRCLPHKVSVTIVQPLRRVGPWAKDCALPGGQPVELCCLRSAVGAPLNGRVGYVGDRGRLAHGGRYLVWLIPKRADHARGKRLRPSPRVTLSRGQLRVPHWARRLDRTGAVRTPAPEPEPAARDAEDDLAAGQIVYVRLARPAQNKNLLPRLDLCGASIGAARTL